MIFSQFIIFYVYTVSLELVKKQKIAEIVQ